MPCYCANTSYNFDHNIQLLPSHEVTINSCQPSGKTTSRGLTT